MLKKLNLFHLTIENKCCSIDLKSDGSVFDEKLSL